MPGKHAYFTCTLCTLIKIRSNNRRRHCNFHGCSNCRKAHYNKVVSLTEEQGEKENTKIESSLEKLISEEFVPLVLGNEGIVVDWESFIPLSPMFYKPRSNIVSNKSKGIKRKSLK
jgi:hypothetical protein